MESKVEPHQRRFARVSVNLFLVSVLSGTVLALYGIFQHFNPRDHSAITVILPYGTPVAVATACAVFLRASAERRKNFAQILLTLLLAVVALETALSAINYHRTLAIAKRNSAETRAEKVRDLRAGGVHAFPQVVTRDVVKDLPDRAFRYQEKTLFPLTGIAGVTTVYCDEGGKWIVFEADELGFRNPSGTWQRGITEIALVGDSYFRGACEEEEDTIAGVLRSRYGGLVNASVGGAGPLHQLAVLREYVVPLRPRIVLWQGGQGSSPPRLSREYDYPALLRYLEPDFRQDLARHAAFLDGSIATWIEKQLPVEVEKSRELHQLAGLGWAGWPPSLATVPLLRNVRSAIDLEIASRRTKNERNAPVVEGPTLERIMSEAKRSVESYGGRLIVVLIPFYDDAAGLSDERSRTEELSILRRLDLPVIDVTSSFRALSNLESYYTPVRVHANAEGYRLMGKIVAKGLERSQ